MGLSETDAELFELAHRLPAAEEYDGDDLIIVEEIVERWMAKVGAGQDLDLRTLDDPEANGREPEQGDVRFVLHLPLENGSTLTIRMGRQGRDTLFGMLIAECHDSGEKEPR